MASSSDNLIRYIRRLAVHAEQSEATDKALLDRFIASRDERAFAALVERHAALVFQVCWRILENTHDAQDAFQATFLVLARKAATVHPPEALPAWLHGVARRVALKARAARFRHRRMERPLAATTRDSRPDPLAELATRDFLAIIDEEVRRLAEVYRLPVILCCLEGRSIEEAAQQLGWTEGSVKGRLERGRARLHARLVRRGLTLPAALAAVEFSRAGASAAMAARQAVSLASAAMSFGARQTSMDAAISLQATALAQSILKSMALAKLKSAAVLMLVTCLLAGGWLAQRQMNFLRMAGLEALPSSIPPSDSAKLVAPPAVGKKDKDKVREETEDRIEVSGRVLDPQGRPIAGAKLYVGYAPRRAVPDAVSQAPIYPLRASSGMDGRFHFTFVRSDLDERYLDASRPVVMATADGFGPDWAKIGSSPAVAVNLRLVEDFPLEGRVLDVQRKPVAGAKVFVTTLSNYPAANLDPLSPTIKRCWGPLPGQPPQVTTAADGRFRLTGLVRDRQVILTVEAPGFPPISMWELTRPAAAQAELPEARHVPFECVASVCRSIRGVVRDKKTGQAVAGAKITVQSSRATTYTDNDGRYELFGRPGRCQEEVVLAQAQDGQPYFAATARLASTNDLAPLIADFELMSGIPLRGRVTNRATGKPPKRAVVEYYPLFPNSYSSALTRLELVQAACSATLQADGSYNLTVLPGPGVVLVAASPRDSYATAVLDAQELTNLIRGGSNPSGGSWLSTAAGGPGNLSWRRCVDCYNAVALIQPDEKAMSLKLDLTVQPARTRRGIVVGPDGQPISDVTVCGLTSIPYAEILDGASFTVEGLNARRTRDLFFHHKEKGLGKFLPIRGDETKALTVQLEPCGVVIGRIVDESGKPVPGRRISLSYGCPGTTLDAQTDRQGCLRAAVVPGFPYPLGPSLLLPKLVGILKVKSGQTKDLGDLVLSDFPR